MKRLLAITAFILPFTSVAYAGPHGGKAKKPVAHTGNTGITGGMDVPDHRVPADKSTGSPTNKARNGRVLRTKLGASGSVRGRVARERRAVRRRASVSK